MCVKTYAGSGWTVTWYTILTIHWDYVQKALGSCAQPSGAKFRKSLVFLRTGNICVKINMIDSDEKHTTNGSYRADQ